MIEKKDWELILKNNTEEKEKLIKMYNLSIPQFDAIITLAKTEITKFPDEKPTDPMPDALKDIAKEIIK